MRRSNQLSAKLVKKIVDGVQRTTTIELACAIAGVSEAGFYKWQDLGRVLIADEVDQDEMTPDELLCVELVESVELARKLSCLPAIDTIQKAIKMGDVKAAEKLLARRMADQYGSWPLHPFPQNLGNELSEQQSIDPACVATFEKYKRDMNLMEQTLKLRVLEVIEASIYWVQRQAS